MESYYIEEISSAISLIISLIAIILLIIGDSLKRKGTKSHNSSMLKKGNFIYKFGIVVLIISVILNLLDIASTFKGTF